MILTVEQFSKIMPKAKGAAAWVVAINVTADKNEINTPLRLAAFLAQLAHESAQFRYMEEIASGAAYEGRKDLGNTQKGDGIKYKGRGPIQLTGRANYRRAGQDLKLALEEMPQIVATPSVGLLVAGWYWKLHGLNFLADAKEFDRITKKINGGYNGKADRDSYYKKAVAVLGA